MRERPGGKDAQTGTQTVFGEGRASARLVLVGEQPGDREDREGRPFVGPAGRLLDDALARRDPPPEERRRSAQGDGALVDDLRIVATVL